MPRELRDIGPYRGLQPSQRRGSAAASGSVGFSEAVLLPQSNGPWPIWASLGCTTGIGQGIGLQGNRTGDGGIQCMHGFGPHDLSITHLSANTPCPDRVKTNEWIASTRSVPSHPAFHPCSTLPCLPLLSGTFCRPF